MEVAFDFPTLHFPQEFLFGSAVASFQVENPEQKEVAREAIEKILFQSN